MGLGHWRGAAACQAGNRSPCIRGFCFFSDPATAEIYTLSLHDALPIWNIGEARYSRRPPSAYATSVLLLADIPDRKSTRLNSSHANISYAVFCLKKKTETSGRHPTATGRA